MDEDKKVAEPKKAKPAAKKPVAKKAAPKKVVAAQPEAKPKAKQKEIKELTKGIEPLSPLGSL